MIIVHCSYEWDHSRRNLLKFCPPASRTQRWPGGMHTTNAVTMHANAVDVPAQFRQGNITISGIKTQYFDQILAKIDAWVHKEIITIQKTACWSINCSIFGIFWIFRRASVRPWELDPMTNCKGLWEVSYPARNRGDAGWKGKHNTRCVLSCAKRIGRALHLSQNVLFNSENAYDITIHGQLIFWSLLD